MKWINISLILILKIILIIYYYWKRCKAFNAINKDKIMDFIAELKYYNFTIKNIYNLYNIKYEPNTFSQYTDFKEIH